MVFRGIFVLQGFSGFFRVLQGFSEFFMGFSEFFCFPLCI